MEEELQALDTKPEVERLGSPLEISASPGTLLDRKGKSSVCSQVYACGLWLRKARGGCAWKAGALTPWPDLERNTVSAAHIHQVKGLSLFKPRLVFRCCRIKTKQIIISLAGSETWKYLDSIFLLISCTKNLKVVWGCSSLSLWPQGY